MSCRYCCTSSKNLFFPFYTCSDCPSLISPPLPFFILSFLPFTPSSPSPHLLSHLPLSSTPLLWFKTYWVRMLSLQQNNEVSLLPPSPFFLTIFVICSYIVCLPVCLPVSFSVPHTSVWQPVVSNKTEKNYKTKAGRDPWEGSRAAGTCSRLWAGMSREGNQHFPYYSHPFCGLRTCLCNSLYRSWTKSHKLCLVMAEEQVSHCRHIKIGPSPSLYWG